MNERELRERFREEFDAEQPPPGAYQAAVDDAVGRQGGRLPRWAAPAAALLAVAMVAALLPGQRAPRTQPATFSVTRAGPTPGELTARAGPTPTALPAGLVGTPAAAHRESPSVHVAALDSRTAMASAGDMIERTTDGGQHWTVLFPGVAAHNGTVRDLEWVTATVAFAASSYGLLRLDTEPAGWSLVNRRDDLQRLDFLTPLEGYVIAGDRVLRTADGGGTFAGLDVGLDVVSWIQWVTFNQGWAAGPRGVVATSDGGHSWRRQLDFIDPPSTAGAPGAAVAPAWTQVGIRDDLTGFAYHRDGGTGLLFHTRDGGSKWTPAPRQLEGTTSDLVVTGRTSAELVQAKAPGRSQLCGTEDAGASWHCSDLPLGGDPGQLAVRGRTQWLALQDSGAVFATSSDGRTWAARRRPLDAPSD